MENLLFATKQGKVKKTGAVEYQNIRQNGLIAIALETGDELLGVHPTAGNDHILLITKEGKCIMFHEDEVRPTGRATQGVRGITIKKEDYVIGMEIIEDGLNHDEVDVLVISENGYGKRTPLSEYAAQGRGGQGVFTAKISSKTGKLAAMHVIKPLALDGKKVETPEEEDSELNSKDILVVSKKGQVIRLPLDDVPHLGRHTQGVRIIKLDNDDKVSAFALL